MRLTRRLEMVRFDKRADNVTVQVALDGRLAVPFTVGLEEFYGEFPTEQARHEFLERSARTLLDLFDDARFGMKLSDQEVSHRAAA